MLTKPFYKHLFPALLGHLNPSDVRTPGYPVYGNTM